MSAVVDEAAAVKVAAGMRPTLLVTLSTDVEVRDAPPAVQHYAVSVCVRWSSEEGPDVDLATLSEMADVDFEDYLAEVDLLPPRTVHIPVGHGDVYVADLAAPSCWEELAQRGPDVRLVGDALLGEDFDMREVREAFDLVHQRALVLNFIEIAPQWRGADYGLLVAELAISVLGRCTDLVVLFPMAPGLTDLEQRAASNRGLGQYWGRIGFTPFNGIMARPPV